MHSMWALLGSALLGLSQVSAISEPFSLYAYGTGISGLPVFYMGCKLPSLVSRLLSSENKKKADSNQSIRLHW